MTNRELEKKWNQFLVIAKDNVPIILFKTWFESIVPYKFEDYVLIIQVPTTFFYEYLEKQYLDILGKGLKKIFGENVKLEYNIVLNNNAFTNALLEENKKNYASNYKLKDNSLYTNLIVNKIFISYAKEDRKYALKLYNSLYRYGFIEPWLDEKNLLPGMNWENEIFSAINESNFVIVILSNVSISKRGFVQKELKKAIDVFLEMPPNKLFIIPARIDPCEPNYNELKKNQYVDLFEDWDVGVEKIIKSIRFSSKI